MNEMLHFPAEDWTFSKVMKTTRRDENKKGFRGINILLEPSIGRLPEIPSHNCPQMVRGFVVGLSYSRGRATANKYP
jgi:hypothetical protein